ncbi:uncharacterized protein EKO05_0011477 [Ascochyta rabiei]|uniref:uncharacterized protein n=1 Tax=Didymella rabiei TaxID=5454 RepID=UPI0022021082|nr:uncharacterized protein EKO05_0011477 [Ascochyta rabiei]UPX21287.1 hypothetical protein EKO05_0011477 [Ascochyta rabiei]
MKFVEMTAHQLCVFAARSCRAANRSPTSQLLRRQRRWSASLSNVAAYSPRPLSLTRSARASHEASRRSGALVI